MLLTALLFVAGVSSPLNAIAGEQAVQTASVKLEQPVNGTIKLTPPIPDSGRVELGSVITVTTAPDPGFAVDSIYYYNPGEGMWRLYHETTLPQWKVTVERDKVIGASFIETDALQGFTVRQDVVYAQPGVKKLKYDVFTPNGAEKLPCVVIIHGGGWMANTEEIMRGLARELVRTGDYVVCSIDYRWMGDGDGDETPNSMADIIEDVYGAIAHIQQHAAEYGADPTRLAVTGDSAGGHLSAAAANMVSMIGDGGFGVERGLYQYKPTYIPPGKTLDRLRREISDAIKVAAPSYGVFGGDLLRGRLLDKSGAALKAVSPIEHIPNADDRPVPQYLLRGTRDMLIQHGPVQTYADALKAAGQTVTYDQVPGAGHAFFDWKPDSGTKATFAEYGVPYAAKMKAFFDEVFYP